MKKKRHGCLTAILIFIALIAVFVLYGKIQEANRKNARLKSFSDITWPTSSLASRVPVPDSTFGRIEYESDSRLKITFAKVEQADFTAYTDTCMEKGFSVNYSRSSSLFNADDSDGYHLYVYYSSSSKEMELTASAPQDSESEPVSSEDVESEATSESEAVSSEVSASEVEEEPAAESEESSSDAVTTGIRPEFKESVDSYESFMNEYVDFMKKYQDSNGSDPKMLADYATFLSKYADMTDKFDKLSDDETSTEEDVYYLQAQSRVLAKLSEIS